MIKSKTSFDIKIQSDKWKKPLILNMEKNQNILILIIKCAEELKCKPEQIKLKCVLL